MGNNLAQKAATTPPQAAQGDGGEVTSEPRTLSEEMEGGGKGEGEREVEGEDEGEEEGDDGDVGVELHDVGDGGLLEEDGADEDAPSPPKKKAAVHKAGDAPPPLSP